MNARSLQEIRADNPVPDQAEYAHAYSQADLAGRLAEMVYSIRTGVGLTQSELARRMGTTQSSIARLEGAAHVPTLDLLMRLGTATGTPIVISTALGHRIELNSA
jgi:ribosome-binding protein aMBF1 (putative translation factor)